MFLWVWRSRKSLINCHFLTMELGGCMKWNKTKNKLKLIFSFIQRQQIKTNLFHGWACVLKWMIYDSNYMHLIWNWVLFKFYDSKFLVNDVRTSDLLCWVLNEIHPSVTTQNRTILKLYIVQHHSNTHTYTHILTEYTVYQSQMCPMQWWNAYE